MREAVENYYGSVLTQTADLRTNPCTTSRAPSGALQELIANVHVEVNKRYYGCELIYPARLEGLRGLDLGCGTGRDCYVLAQLVGPHGSVVGVDMTDAQLAVANTYRDWHTARFGYAESNVEFHKGDIEKLDELGLEPGSFDIIVSNCVLNLAADKAAVLRGAHALLREGGELYFCDVYASRSFPDELAADPVVYGECLGGDFYWNDFDYLARSSGFPDPRRVENAPIALTDAAIARRTATIEFLSASCRFFKPGGLEPVCEDYGQAVTYRGGRGEHADVFVLDKHHETERGRISPICGKTWRMLHDRRFAEDFEFLGDFELPIAAYSRVAA